MTPPEESLEFCILRLEAIKVLALDDMIMMANEE
jgi:hypothetical protein